VRKRSGVEQREELRRLDVGIDDDAEGEEGDGDRAGENPALHTAGQRQRGDRKVEKVGDSQPRDLEDDERHEHERIARDRELRTSDRCW